MNFMNWFHHQQDTIKIFDDVFLKEGEMLNIYGDSYVGKTLTCYYIIHNNPNKAAMYVDSENSLYPTLEEIAKKTPICYSMTSDLGMISSMIQTYSDKIDYFIIDSVTALDVENEEKRYALLRIFGMIENTKKNLIMVSQERWNGRMFYENKKFMDYFAYKAEVKPTLDGCIINDRYCINKNFLNSKGGN